MNFNNADAETAIGGVKIPSCFFMAPLAGFTDMIFRRAVRQLGGLGLAYTEMLNPRSILSGHSAKRAALLATSEDDRPLSWQIYGTDAAEMIEAAQWLVAHGARLIDINMGCPQRKIAGRGAGAGLLREPAKAVALAGAVAERAGAPVTVKLRLGVSTNILAETSLIQRFEDVGVAAVTIHARTLKQRFTGEADWNVIRIAAQSVSRMAIIGNGDITSPEKAVELLRQTGCAAVMLGRAALKNPWIFRDADRLLRGLPPAPPPTQAERFNFLLRHLNAMHEAFGPKTGVLLFRKWLPHYAPGLGIERRTMVAMLGITSAEKLIESLHRHLASDVSCQA